jgi:hypothetical protein
LFSFVYSPFFVIAFCDDFFPLYAALPVVSSFPFLRAHPLNGSSPLNDPDEHNDNGNNQQDMNKITHRIAAHQSQQPQNDQYDRNCPQHVILLSAVSFSLPAIVLSYWPAARMGRLFVLDSDYVMVIP